MKEYEYKFTYDAGNGEGRIQADSKDDAISKLKDIYSPTEKGDKPLKNLVFKVTEVEPAPEA